MAFTNMAVADLFEFSCIPMWIEIVIMIVFGLGFAVLRTRYVKQAPAPKKRKTEADAQNLLSTSIEEQAAKSDWAGVLQLWRAAKAYAPTQPKTMKFVVQAFLEAEPEALVPEIIEHIAAHPVTLWDQTTAAMILQSIGAAGHTSAMEDMLSAMVSELNLHPTVAMHEALIAGNAYRGQVEQVAQCMSRARESGARVSVRAYALAIKGLLQKGEVDAAVTYMQEMGNQGFAIPPFAVHEAFRLACANSMPEQLERALSMAEELKVKLTVDAVVVLTEHCLQNQDLALGKRVEHLARTTRTTLPLRAYDSLLKLYVGKADADAFMLFEEMRSADLPISDGLCVGLLSRAADSKNLKFADVIVAHVRKFGKMSISHYSALMKVYAYCGRYDMACDLYGTIVQEGLEPDQVMYSCFMKFAVESNRMAFLKELTSKVPTLDLQNSMSLVRAAMKDKDVDGAFRVLKQLKATGTTPDVTAYNAVLNVCAVAGDMQNAVTLFEEMKQTLKLDLTSYNTVLKAFCTTSDKEGAWGLMQELKDAGLKPNDVTFNCLINMSVSSGDTQGAWDTIREMEFDGIAVDHYTVATMMKVARCCKSTKDLNQALDLLDRSGLDVCQDEVLLNSVLEACTRHRETKRLDRVMTAFEESSLQPAVHTYAALIRACGILRRVSCCERLWSHMVNERKMMPTDIALGCLLDAFINNNYIDRATQYFEEWRACVPPNKVMYSTLLKGFANAHMSEAATNTLADMRSMGIPLCTKVYNSIIDAHARKGDMDQIATVLQMMVEDDCKADNFTRSLVVKGYCAKGDLDKALDAFRDAREAGNIGDTVGYNNLLDGCVQQNRMGLADSLLEQMDNLAVVPSSFTLAIVVKMWGRRKKLERAFEYVHSWPMKYGFALNGPVQTSLMSACLKNNSIDRAIEVFDTMRHAGTAADSKAYGSLILGCVRLGQQDEAIRIAKEAYGLASKFSGSTLPNGQSLEPQVRDQLRRIMASRASSADQVDHQLMQCLVSGGTIKRRSGQAHS